MISVLSDSRFLSAVFIVTGAARPCLGPKLSLRVNENISFEVAELVVEVIHPLEDGLDLAGHPG